MSKRKRVALVDVGSNTVRLCAYDVDRAAGTYKKVFDVCEFAGLGACVTPSGKMSGEGIAKAAKTVRKLTNLAKEAGCGPIHVFATAAVRNCSNAKAVVKAVRKASDCDLRILSAIEECQLSTLGAMRSTGVRSGLVFDLGGGSTEVVGLHDGKIVEMDSIPVGTLSSWAKRDGDSFLQGAEELKAIEDGFLTLLTSSHVDVFSRPNVVGVGGSARFARKLVRRLDDRQDNDRFVTVADLERIMALAQERPGAFSRLVMEMKPSRIHTILPGCAIIRALLKATDAPGFTVSRAGLREGYLLAMVLGLGTDVLCKDLT